MQFLTLALALVVGTTTARLPSKNSNGHHLFDTIMPWLDNYYDPSYKFLYEQDAKGALRHTVRESSWYALGLLVRNEGRDAKEAEEIIYKIIDSQFTDPNVQWYGTYQRYPEEPIVGSSVYPSRIYSTWDPNWRGFVGTTFILMIEEYSNLLSTEIRTAMINSLRHAVVGDSYRVGGLDGDNLYPGYSNPVGDELHVLLTAFDQLQAIMRAFASGWLGRRIKDENMTVAGENYANEIIELFNITGSLSEFNSGTYTGVSLYGLTLWSTYITKESVMARHGPQMVLRTWEKVSELWHPRMKNLAGPWDRTYGYDMNRYFSVMGLWFWSYLGREQSSLIEYVRTLLPETDPKVTLEQSPAMSHSADLGWGILVAVLADYQAKHLPEGFFDDLVRFQGEHVSNTQVYYPPYDLEIRNLTTWLTADLTIGAQSFSQRNVGGPTPTGYTPAAVQWFVDGGDDEIGFLVVGPTAGIGILLAKDCDSSDQLRPSFSPGSHPGD